MLLSLPGDSATLPGGVCSRFPQGRPIVDPDLPLTELARRQRLGDAAAADALFTYYAARLGRLAEQHLSRRLAGRVDAGDVVQSAFRTFFLRSARGEFQIDSRAGLWKLLVTITVRKARMQGRQHAAAGRDVRREEPSADRDGLWEPLDHEPGPEEAAVMLDEIDSLLRDLPPLCGEVLQRRLQGVSVVAVAQELGVSRQTVYRMLALMQQRLGKSLSS